MTRVVAPFASRTLRAARAINDDSKPGRRRLELTSEQKRIARHLSWQEGVSVEDIREKLGLDCTYETMLRKLRELNIMIRSTRRRVHPERAQ